MANWTDRREARWRNTEAAVANYGTELYRFLSRFLENESVDGQPRLCDDCWVAVFAELFRNVQLYLSARDQAVWVTETAVALCKSEGIEIDYDALIAVMRACRFENAISSPLQPQAPASNVEGEESWDMSETFLANSPTAAGIPEETWNRLRTQLLAIEASWEAQRRRSGSPWTRYAVLGTALLGLSGVAYGVIELELSLHHAVHPMEVKTSLDAKLPPPLSNLPTTTLAQFRVSQGSGLPSMAHTDVTSNTLYVANLVSGATGTNNIQVKSLPFSDSGNTWSSAIQAVGQIPLSNPGSAQSSSGTAFSLAQWDVTVSGNWVVAVVSWTDSQTSSPAVVQVYQLDLATHKSRMVKELKSKPKQNTIYAIAAGEGRVVIQPGVQEGTGSGATVIGLPIQVYRISDQGKMALTTIPTQIPGTFGLMTKPTVVNAGIIFQGIDGQSTSVTAGDATWFELSWNGSLASLQGPPVDNQPHWALESAVGQLWWVETTSASAKGGSQGAQGSQILMGRLGPVGSVTDTPAQTLSGPVQKLGVTGSRLIWEQTDNNVTQLVVSEVTQ